MQQPVLFLSGLHNLVWCVYLQVENNHEVKTKTAQWDSYNTTVLNASTGSVLAELRIGPSFDRPTVLLAHNGKYIIANTHSGFNTIFDLNRRTSFVVPSKRDELFSNDGKFLITDNGTAVSLWNIPARTVLVTLPIKVNSGADDFFFSANSKKIIIANRACLLNKEPPRNIHAAIRQQVFQVSLPDYISRMQKTYQFDDVDKEEKIKYGIK